jgi:hypothetical protein
MGALLALLLAQPDDDPWITGGTDPDAPYTIRIPGLGRVSYRYLEPLATALGLTADLAKALRSGDADVATTLMAKSLHQQVVSKSFFRGISDISALVQAVGRGDPMQAVGKWAANFGASWVPNVYRSTVRAFRPTWPQMEIGGVGIAEQGESFLRRLAQGTELPIGQVAGALGAQGLAESLERFPQRDVWGDPIPAKQPVVDLGDPLTDVPFRLLAPVYLQEGTEPFVGKQVLAAWNRLHPEREWRPGEMSRYYNLPGTAEQKYMTDEEYEELNLRAGALLREMVSSREWNTDAPTEHDLKLLQKLVETARSVARRAALAEWMRAKGGGLAYGQVAPAPRGLAPMPHAPPATSPLALSPLPYGR